MKKLFLALLLLINVQHAIADDRRIKTEFYSDDVVYKIYTKVGRTSLIQFSEGEFLKGNSEKTLLGLGDSEAWELGVRGNNIALKPKKPFPDTNINVVTNKRTYSFDLISVQKSENVTYVVRFNYPPTQEDFAKRDTQKAIEIKKEQILTPAKAEKVSINTEYVWKGEREELKPTAAYDDGRFTRLVYDNAGQLPVFFNVMPDGSEALINYSVDPDDKRTIILEGVIKTARARLNNDVIEIINKNYQLPKFNNFGTSVHGTVRVNKGSLE